MNNQPSNVDDDLRNEISLDILHDTNANGAHVEAIVKLIQSHKERWQLEVRIDENALWKPVAEEIVAKDGVYRGVNYLNKRSQELHEQKEKLS